MLRTTAAALIAVAVLILPTPSADAADPVDTPAVVLGDVEIPAGTSDVVTASEFDAAREAADAGRVDVPESIETSVAEDTADAAADHGVYVDPDAVDVVPLYDGDVVVGVPAETQVDSMRIVASADGRELNASLSTSEPEDAPATTAPGPGMALSWASNGAGSYVIKIYQKGDLKIDGRFTWKRKKLLGDGDPTKVHYTYERFGDAQPSSQTGPDPRVIRLRIQNFPYDEIEPALREWDRYSPGSDRGDNCNSYNASISYGGLGISVPFTEGCGTYNMWRNVDKPSSYWLQYESGGVNPSGGNKEVGYVIMWSQKEGTLGSQHDLQQIRLGWPAYYWGAYETCSQTDAGRTC